MLRVKTAVVMTLFFVVLGMAAAETYEQALIRHNQEIKALENDFRILETFRWLWDWGLFIVLMVMVIITASHGSRFGKYQFELKQQSELLARNAELTNRVDVLSQQNLDLINRHEELIKLLLSKMGTQAPTQNVVVQQHPKPLPKPTREIVEINPNSPADQVWLAKQKKKQG